MVTYMRSKCGFKSVVEQQILLLLSHIPLLNFSEVTSIDLNGNKSMG